MVSRAKSKWYENKKIKKLVLNSQIQTYKILTNKAEVLNKVVLVLSLAVKECERDICIVSSSKLKFDN